MKTISLALYAEGTTDYRFLPIIIQNTVERILFLNDCPDIAVVEPTLITDVKGDSGAENIYNAAKEAQGVHILFVHLDADARTIEKARSERFIPGRALVNNSEGKLCKDIVPIIPVKNIEAWLVCDYEAFCNAVGTRATAEELGLPNHPRLVEALPDPKQSFKEALRIAHVARRKRSRYEPGEYYELLARTINLDTLLRVPAYIAFYNELTEALKKLRVIN